MWSEDLKNMTKAQLQTSPIALLKSENGRCGVLIKKEENQFIVYNRSTKEKMTFVTIEELVEAGWVLD